MHPELNHPVIFQPYRIIYVTEH